MVYLGTNCTKQEDDIQTEEDMLTQCYDIDNNLLGFNPDSLFEADS